MPFNAEKLDEVLQALGELLEQRGYRFEVVAIGGGGLLLLGFVARPTKDLDLVAIVAGGGLTTPTPLPSALQEASTDVARAYELADDWLNAGPADLLELGLPAGFMSRAVRRVFGGLVVHLASREDQIFFKFYAAADEGPRSKHFQDLKKLAPSRSELQDAARWTRTHDPSDGFRMMCVGVLEALGVEVPDDL